MATKPQKWARILGWLVPAGFAAVCLLYLAAVHLAGGSLPGGLLYAVVFAVLVVLPGLLLCRLFLPGLPRAATPVVAVALGATLLMLCFVVFGGLGLPLATAAVPLAASIWWAVGSWRLWRARRPALAPPAPWAFGWLAIAAAVLFLCIFSGVFPFARPGAVGGAVYDQDALWGVGSTASAWYGFPIRDLRTAGGLFHYHYFSDTVAGLVAVFSGQHPWDVNFYYLRGVWLLLMLLGTYAAARGLGAGGWGALVPVFGVSLGLFCNLPAINYVLINPNNVTQSYVFVLAAVLVLLHWQQAGFKGWRPLPALGLALLAVVWGKGSVGVLFLMGMAAAFVVYAVLKRRVYWLLLAGLGLGAAGAAVLLGLLFSGANINLFFAPDAQRALGLLTAILQNSWPLLLLYLMALIYTIRHFFSISFVALTLNAIVFGGIAANCLFDHYGAADSYFHLMALFVMWLCLAPALPALLSRKAGTAAVLALCAVGLAGNLYLAAPQLRLGVQAAMRCVGIRPAFPAEYATLTPGDEEAANWLRANMGKADVFATNRNQRALEGMEGIFHGYTALSGRQAFVEGWYYAMEYSMDYHQLRHNLEQVSDGLFACHTFDEAAAIARENGITHILLHLPSGGAPFAGGTPAYQNDTVLIYTVTP